MTDTRAWKKITGRQGDWNARVEYDDGSIEVLTTPNDFMTVKDALAKTGLRPEFAEVIMKPITEVDMRGEDAQRMQKLLDALESLDDVQDVYTSAVIEEA